MLVEVRAAGIRPGEAHIRRGALHDSWSATCPSRQGRDLVGVVVEVCGTTAYATVFAADPQPADTVVVSGAAGGGGSLAGQFAQRRGATVIGLASKRNHAWLKQRGVVPVEYREGWPSESGRRPAGASTRSSTRSATATWSRQCSWVCGPNGSTRMLFGAISIRERAQG
ncbi:hypothetical protein ACWDBD_41420 [Streptomyces sp. NPDC001118]